MLHTKAFWFRRRSFFKVFTIYVHGGHLGHVTWTIWTNFCSPIWRRLDLPRVSFVNCCQFMYLVISLLGLRAGCGIWLYQFLIIAYLFTFHMKFGFDRPSGFRGEVWKCWHTHRRQRPTFTISSPAYLSTFWKFHGGASAKTAILDRLFKQRCTCSNRSDNFHGGDLQKFYMI